MIRLILKLSICLLLVSSCANIAPLTGGAKDTKAPEVLSVMPSKSLIQAMPKQKFTIEFSEFIQSVPENMIQCIPNFRLQKYKSSNSRIEFELPDSLYTGTYQVQFTNLIKDLNEGNLIPQFTLVFSTNNFIDSNSIHLQILDAKTKLKIPKFNLFAKHIESQLSYPCISDSTGKVKLQYLQAGKYAVYSFQDINTNSVLDSNESYTSIDTLESLYVPDSIQARQIIIEVLQAQTKKPKLYAYPKSIIVANVLNTIAVKFDKQYTDSLQINLDSTEYFFIDSLPTKAILHQDTLRVPKLISNSRTKKSTTIENPYTFKHDPCSINSILIQSKFPFNLSDSFAIYKNQDSVQYTIENIRSNEVRLKFLKPLNKLDTLKVYTANLTSPYYKTEKDSQSISLILQDKSSSQLILPRTPDVLCDIYSDKYVLLFSQIPLDGRSICLKEFNIRVFIYTDSNKDNKWTFDLKGLRESKQELLPIQLKAGWEIELVLPETKTQP